MAAHLHEFLSSDHERLDALFDAALHLGDMAAYDAFRRGLLRHISIEERVLFPLLRKRRGVTPLERRLHRDHAALAALLVPPPTTTELTLIAEILAPHNAAEEEAGGLYELIEDLAAEELSPLMDAVHAIPEVPVMPHTDSPIVRSTIEQLVREAKYGIR